VKALKKEEVYSGPYMHAAPDLVYDWENLAVYPNDAFNFSKIISNDFDGKVLKDAFLDDYRKRNPIRFQERVEIALQRGDEDKTYTAKELDMIAEQLRSLGYL